MNELIISGRITKDLELKKTSNGSVVLPFDVAVQREFKNQNGEYDSDFIPCLATNGTAEFIAKYTEKGNFITLTGRIQNNNYERPDGTTNYGMQMLVRSADSQSIFMNKNKNQSNSNAFDYQETEPTVQRGNPYPQQSQQDNQFKSNNQGHPSNINPFSNGNTVGIDDDDLPF